MTQKGVFLESEGDAWFRRNTPALQGREMPGSDPVLMSMVDLPLPAAAKVLEVGCGDGGRLAWLMESRGFLCAGVDPSGEAVAMAGLKGVDARVATADQLPFADSSFDVVVFGFCLYLCDREDLFRIAAEADRVLADPGWLVILDFDSPCTVKREYHHRPGIFTYKMDYTTLFSWHPSYVCLSRAVRSHGEGRYTDDPAEWVATSVLRKNSARDR